MFGIKQFGYGLQQKPPYDSHDQPGGGITVGKITGSLSVGGTVAHSWQEMMLDPNGYDYIADPRGIVATTNPLNCPAFDLNGATIATNTIVHLKLRGWSEIPIYDIVGVVTSGGGSSSHYYASASASALVPSIVFSFLTDLSPTEVTTGWTINPNSGGNFSTDGHGRIVVAKGGYYQITLRTSVTVRQISSPTGVIIFRFAGALALHDDAINQTTPIGCYVEYMQDYTNYGNPVDEIFRYATEIINVSDGEILTAQGWQWNTPDGIDLSMGFDLYMLALDHH